MSIDRTPTDDSEVSESWTWGDLFELDIPDHWVVRDLDDAVEIRSVGSAGGRIHLAVLDGVGTGEAAIHGLIGRFAATRGQTTPTIEARRDLHGVVHARCAWAEGSGEWLVQAAIWDGRGVLCTAYGDRNDSGAASVISDAELLMGSLKPLHLVVPSTLEPDLPGDF